jgi:hypothetical protein
MWIARAGYVLIPAHLRRAHDARGWHKPLWAAVRSIVASSILRAH